MKQVIQIFDGKIPTILNEKAREAVRLIILNPLNKEELLVQHLGRWDIVTIPGGGIEEHETPILAVKREALEETGYRVNVVHRLGCVVEYRSENDFYQNNHCLLAEIIGEQEQLQLTAKESEYGLTNAWMKIDVFHNMLLDSRRDYHKEFIRKRDIAFVSMLYQYHRNR